MSTSSFSDLNNVSFNNSNRRSSSDAASLSANRNIEATSICYSQKNIDSNASHVNISDKLNQSLDRKFQRRKRGSDKNKGNTRWFTFGQEFIQSQLHQMQRVHTSTHRGINQNLEHIVRQIQELIKMIGVNKYGKLSSILQEDFTLNEDVKRIDHKIKEVQSWIDKVMKEIAANKKQVDPNILGSKLQQQLEQKNEVTINFITGRTGDEIDKLKFAVGQLEKPLKTTRFLAKLQQGKKTILENKADNITERISKLDWSTQTPPTARKISLKLQKKQDQYLTISNSIGGNAVLKDLQRKVELLQKRNNHLKQFIGIRRAD